MIWWILQFAVTTAAFGYLWWQDGQLRLQRMLADSWRQSSEGRQKTIDRLLAAPQLVREEQRAILEDRQRLN